MSIHAPDIQSNIDLAARAIASAEAILITAGAGMGVDSGLPDFRGNEGFWKAYPQYKNLGLDFVSLANPRWFRSSPTLAWGFYGHRLNLYKAMVPHEGYQVLKKWAMAVPKGFFVFTSNVDGHFQKAGFPADRIVECHGSILRMQSLDSCTAGVWDGGDLVVKVDPVTMRAAEPLPRVPGSERLARPNILMFGDGEWDSMVTDEQHDRYSEWLMQLPRPSRLVVIELGAGETVATIRREGEARAARYGGTLIRINPSDSQCGSGHISLPMSALAALQAIDSAISALKQETDPKQTEFGSI
jgi:NAD-dependent SIR2 family protein deacetylase